MTRFALSPICTPDGTKSIPLETRAFVAVAPPGTRAPHAWISDERSTLDLLGSKGFVLLRLGTHPPEAGAMIDAAARRRVPLQVVDLADPAVAALYEKSLVLMRPDGHVAWRADHIPPDALTIIDCVRGATPTLT
jgi:hypothetical protein